MITIVVNGENIRVENGSLISNCLPNSHGLALPCAGKGSCGKCRVIATGELSPYTTEELAHLTQNELQKNVRLACCAKVLGSACISFQSSTGGQICTDVSKFVVDEPLFKEYGIAIDVGTTTVVAQLYSKTELLSQKGEENAQRIFGADVISRIEKSIQGDGEQLAKCIQKQIAAMIIAMCKEAEIQENSIDYLVITGNTAMLCLLTQRNVTSLSCAPFVAEHLFGEEILAKSLNLPCESAKVYLPRCISAFVGADITTALLASKICIQTQTSMLADIGTNGEIALWHNGVLSCCSTAAGPAFEGVGLAMGMMGVQGAIDHVEIENEKIKVNVIGKTAAVGICGSGIVDAIAALLQLDILDETGALEENEIVIKAPVKVTQQDIRNVQLAKSAIHAGIATLLQTQNVKESNVEQFVIAGGFGSYLNVKKAAEIGLFPKKLAIKSKVIGNAALSGAVQLLHSKKLVEQSRQLATKANTIELSANPLFMEEYVEKMMF